MAEAKKQETSVKTEEVTAWDEELSGKKRLFVLFYCTEDECFLNGTRAYLKAYKNCQSENAAAVNAGKLLRNAKVKQAIKKLLRLARDEDDEQAVYRMIKQFEQLSFYNPADIIDASGALRVKDLKELGALALCVEQIETRVNTAGSYTVVKLANRQKAMEAFSKYLNIIRPEVDLQAMMPVVMLTGKNSEFEKEEK
jgi:phage terminase, small subunit, putative|nr:MAG TPA: Terminase small subunit [Caudoviricetes sp.]